MRAPDDDPSAVPADEPPAEPAQPESAPPRGSRGTAASTDADAGVEQPKRTRSRAKADAAVDAPGEESAPERSALKPRRRSAAKAAEQPAPAEEEAAPVGEAAGEDEAPAAPRRARRTVGPPALPRLGRGRRKPERVGEPPVVYATAKYVRSSARKARLVCDHIRGKSVPEARAILAFAPRGVAKDWSKLLESAVANAEHNHELIGDELKIKAISADVGPTLKRFRPRAQGRATPIHKRTSHLSIALTPKE